MVEISRRHRSMEMSEHAKICPCEPTKEMLLAAMKSDGAFAESHEPEFESGALVEDGLTPEDCAGINASTMEYYRESYKAMLALCPSAPDANGEPVAWQVFHNSGEYDYFVYANKHEADDAANLNETDAIPLYALCPSADAVRADAARYREARNNPAGFSHLLRLMIKDDAKGEALDKMMDRIIESRANAIAALAKDNHGKE